MANKKVMPGTGGNQYVPYDERKGEKSIVYFTRNLSPEGLKKYMLVFLKGLKEKSRLSFIQEKQKDRILSLALG